MKTLLTLFLISAGTFCNAQNIDTASLLFCNDWKPTKKIANPYLNRTHWFDQDTVRMYLAEKFDLTPYIGIKEYQYIENSNGFRSLVNLELGETINLDLFKGEKIRFDSNGQVYYYHGMKCSVGETLKTITALKYQNGKVLVQLYKYPWNAPNEKTKYEYNYNIVEITNQKIVLVKYQ